MKATIIAALLLFPALPASAWDGYPDGYGSDAAEPRGRVVADLRPAYRILAENGPERGQSLVPYDAVEPGCSIELKTLWVNGVIERTSRPVCRFVDGTVRPLH